MRPSTLPPCPTAIAIQQLVQPPTEMYIVVVGIATVIAIAIATIVIVLMLRKRP